MNNNLNSELAKVISDKGSIRDAQHLIHNGADVNCIFSAKVQNPFEYRLRKWSMLDLAVRCGDYSMVELLLDNGADPNSGRLTPVMVSLLNTGHLYYIDYATCYNDYYPALSEAIWNTKNIDIVKLLLRYNADPNYKSEHYEVSVNPEFNSVHLIGKGTHCGLSDALLYSNDVEMLKALLGAGADPNSRYYYEHNVLDDSLDKCDVPVLDIAVRKKKTECLKLLLDAGASLSENCKISYTGSETNVLLKNRRYDEVNGDMRTILKSHGWRRPILPWSGCITYPIV